MGSTNKLWDPPWKLLPPVEPVGGQVGPGYQFTHEEKRRRLKQYRDGHERPVLEKEESMREEP